MVSKHELDPLVSLFNDYVPSLASLCFFIPLTDAVIQITQDFVQYSMRHLVYGPW